jgi:hypothetical protein
MENAVAIRAIRTAVSDLIESRTARDRERKRIVAGRIIGHGLDLLAPFEPEVAEAFAEAGRVGYAGGWEAAHYLADDTLDAIVAAGDDDAWDAARWEDHEAYDQETGHIDGLTEAIERLGSLLGESVTGTSAPRI